jgi:multisubunit Na+/H+ antiporter MnhC subunit
MTEAWVAAAVAGIAALFATGLYALVAKESLLKVLLGLQVLGKAVTLTFVLGGVVLNDVGRAQALVFTIVVIEVIVAALALSLMVNVYRQTGSLNVRAIRRLRG